MEAFAGRMRAPCTCKSQITRSLHGRRPQLQRLNAISSTKAAAAGTTLSKTLLAQQTIAMFGAGAALGPFCDGLHSQHDVLHYSSPSIQLQLDLGVLQWSFESCWWVPLLFGVAGAIIGVGVPLLDHLAQQAKPQQSAGAGASMGWLSVLLCISLFVVQYWLSGVLEQPLAGATLPGTPLPALDVVLLATAVALWATFDRTPQGFAMAALTAVCGPLVEVLLIHAGLYHYTHPVVLGVPTWIPWVYFAGGPAVGGLGRRVWQQLAADEAEQVPL